jgi:hypothetical protein
LICYRTQRAVGEKAVFPIILRGSGFLNNWLPSSSQT